eukprot:TRINITY_DN70011_c0_g1_i1.p1 TRINITY_DN70011_c0_g1~~TRINITY_DN70011_c0_g1_i1.p1  ORF type:complete len:238 (+),score=38.37 TRINITY_DN70011_c0_g1_i1:36-716(+)
MAQARRGGNESEEGEEICSRDQLICYLKDQQEDADSADEGLARILRDLELGGKSSHPERQVTAKSLFAAFPKEKIMSARTATHLVERTNELVRMNVARIFSKLDFDGEGAIARDDFAKALRDADHGSGKWNDDRIGAVLADVAPPPPSTEEPPAELPLPLLSARGRDPKADPGVRHGQFVRWALSGGTDAADVVRALAGGSLGGDLACRAAVAGRSGRWLPQGPTA